MALALILAAATGCISVRSRTGSPAPSPAAEPAAPHRQVRGPQPSVPFLSSAVQTGRLLFLSGQLGIDPDTGELAPGGAAAEAGQALARIDRLLTGEGLSRRDVVKCTVFLTDIADYGAVNEVYSAYFGDSPPARSAMAVSALARGARVEIECIAAMP
jgi:reactive intermediate/imine deaminase